MPSDKTMKKAKKAAEDDMLEPMPPETDSDMPEAMEEGMKEGMEEGMEAGMDMADDAADMEAMDDDTPMASAEDTIQGALDEGITSAADMMQKLQDAGFEVVKAGGMDPMGDLPPPPTAAPESAGGLRDQVRGAAARALRGMA